jgi:hypothetical protein
MSHSHQISHLITRSLSLSLSLCLFLSLSLSVALYVYDLYNVPSSSSSPSSAPSLQPHHRSSSSSHSSAPAHRSSSSSAPALQTHRSLSLLQFDEMIKEIFGKKYEKIGQAIHLNRKLQALSTKGTVQSWLFQEFTNRHPFLLSPCVSNQKKIMDRILGRNRWWKLTQNRIVCDRGEYKTMEQVRKALRDHHQARSRSQGSKAHVRCVHHAGAERLVSDSVAVSSSSLPPENDLMSWCRDVGSHFTLFDDQRVVVKPLPPVEVPQTIRALRTFSKSSAFSSPHQPFVEKDRDRGGGFDEVKSTSIPITSSSSHPRRHSEMMIEDIE